MSIFLVKRPHQGQSTVMNASDKKQFCELIEANNKSGDVIFDVQTPAALRKIFGFSTPADFVVNGANEYPWLHRLMIDHGEKSLIQKTFMDRTYAPAVGVDLEQKRFDACLEFETHDLSGHELFLTNQAAFNAYSEEDFWQGHNSESARKALGELLLQLKIVTVRLH